MRLPLRWRRAARRALITQDLEGNRQKLACYCNARLVGSSQFQMLILGAKVRVGRDGWLNSLDKSPAQPLVALFLICAGRSRRPG